MPDLRSSGCTPPQWTSSEGTVKPTSWSSDGPSPAHKRRHSPSKRGIVSTLVGNWESRRALNPDVSSSSTHPTPFRVVPARPRDRGSRRHDPTDLRGYGRTKKEDSSSIDESDSVSSSADTSRLTIDTNYSANLAEMIARQEAIEQQEEAVAQEILNTEEQEASASYLQELGAELATARTNDLRSELEVLREQGLIVQDTMSTHTRSRASGSQASRGSRRSARLRREREQPSTEEPDEGHRLSRQNLERFTNSLDRIQLPVGVDPGENSVSEPPTLTGTDLDGDSESPIRRLTLRSTTGIGNSSEIRRFATPPVYRMDNDSESLSTFQNLQTVAEEMEDEELGLDLVTAHDLHLAHQLGMTIQQSDPEVERPELENPLNPEQTTQSLNSFNVIQQETIQSMSDSYESHEVPTVPSIPAHDVALTNELREHCAMMQHYQ